MAPLPLPAWLLPASTLAGPFTFVPTCGVIGATIGPATPPAAADWAPRLSTRVADSLMFVCCGSLPPGGVWPPSGWLITLPPPLALPLWDWLLRALTLAGPLRLVPSWPVTGTTIGPETTPVDCAPWLSRTVVERLRLVWRSSPSAPLPLSAWLLARLPLIGPSRLFWRPRVIGATIGPATRPVDWAPLLSTSVMDELAFDCDTSPMAPLPLPAWLLPALTLAGPLAFVWTAAVTGATTGPAIRPADCPLWLFTTVVELFELDWSTPAGPLPLSAWLLRALTSTGPVRLVWTPTVTGATTGPAIRPVDCPSLLSTAVVDVFAFDWCT